MNPAPDAAQRAGIVGADRSAMDRRLVQNLTMMRQALQTRTIQAQQTCEKSCDSM